MSPAEQLQRLDQRIMRETYQTVKGRVQFEYQEDSAANASALPNAVSVAVALLGAKGERYVQHCKPGRQHKQEGGSDRSSASFGEKYTGALKLPA